MHLLEQRQRHDVVIVGARAAGAATGLLLARLGYDVVVVERAVFPADTISTHQLARGGVVQLDRWGLLDAVLASGAPAIRDISFTADGESIRRAVKDRSGVDFLVAPRRHILDTIVADAAAEAGASVRFGVTFAEVRRDTTGRVIGIQGYDRSGAAVEIDARFVVGADGLTSRVARAVGAGFTEQRRDGGAATYAYYDGVPWQGIELIVSDRSLAGVFPTHDDAACIWITTPTEDARAARKRHWPREAAFEAQLEAAAPELMARLRTGRRVSTVSGMLRMPNHLRQAYGPGWALVGDAGYHRDALTGHGISDAYRDAELLAGALHEALSGEYDEEIALADYQMQRDDAVRQVFELTIALSAYPAVPEFVELQKALSGALDTEAADLAARDLPGERRLETA